MFLDDATSELLIMDSQRYKINFVGDVMLGRLVDQMFPTHVENVESRTASTRVAAEEGDFLRES
jgi:hypothetical protein